MIEFTETAQSELQRIMGAEGKGQKGIRLGVKGGGCSGFTYVMSFESESRDGDRVLNESKIPVFVDSKSMTYLQGLRVDYVTDLLNRGFKFNNPNASQACGCGTSFAV